MNWLVYAIILAASIYAARRIWRSAKAALEGNAEEACGDCPGCCKGCSGCGTFISFQSPQDSGKPGPGTSGEGV